jgi:hypothetical protein
VPPSIPTPTAPPFILAPGALSSTATLVPPSIQAQVEASSSNPETEDEDADVNKAGKEVM